MNFSHAHKMINFSASLSSLWGLPQESLLSEPLLFLLAREIPLRHFWQGCATWTPVTILDHI